ncbi:fluoride efflux transporter CrcB [Gottfriedia luciferensis]|uniref:fluoride efflux transporter CrcB n=1 Tax=Gottfriedia luciferensis TaxID=178774 RepID=UPI000B43AE5C|nr:fluoride efflux transporter CrcB [Gottfriedia luciferensis]
MIIIGIGGGIGAISRYALGTYINKKNTTLFPFGHFFINTIGSFILGLTSFLYLEKVISTTIWLFIGVGILGGFTTFSTFGYEVFQLLLSKKYKTALTYIVLSTLISIGGAYIGFHIFR